MSIYDSTVEMLSLLPENELKAINIVVKDMVVANQQDSFFKPLSKSEMMDKLAESRAQISEGKWEESEVMEKKLAEEFGF